GAFAFVGHAVFQDEVGEIGEAEQPGLLAAEFQDAGDERAVVVGALGGAYGVGFVFAAADFGIVEVGHQGDIVGALEGEAPAFDAFAGGAFARGGGGGGRKAGKLGLFGNDE